MKSTIFVLCALFASVSAIQAMPEEESVNLQVGVEAQARANVREMLKANLRAALERPSGDSRAGIDMWVLPGSVPILPEPSSDPMVFSAVQTSVERGDAWPGPICPGAVPLLPMTSSNPDVFEEAFVQVGDIDSGLPSVADARL